MYRNYRELTEAELDEIAKLYPVTPNRYIARQYNISVDALQDYLAKPRGWKKNHKAVWLGHRNGRSLTEKEVQWIVKHYKHTKNYDILAKFNIGESTLHRLARKHGLKKSKQQIRKMQVNATSHAHAACRKYGIYEETAERMRQVMLDLKAQGKRWPGSFSFGKSNKDRLSPKRYKEYLEKRTASLRKLRRKELARVLFGLPQKTKLRILPDGYTAKRALRASHRYLFRKRGYYVGYGEDTVYYDEETNRSPGMEASAHKWGLTVEEWKDG